MDATRHAIRTLLTEQARTEAPTGDIYVTDVEATKWALRVVISADYAPDREGDWESPQELAQDIADELKRRARPRYGGGSTEFEVDGPHPGTASGGGLAPGDFWIDVFIEDTTEKQARQRVADALRAYGDLYAG